MKTICISPNFLRAAELRASIVIVLFALFFNSCAEPPVQEVVESMPKVDSVAVKNAIKREQDSTYTAFFLQQHIGRITTGAEVKIRAEYIFSDKMMPSLYDSHGYQLLWVDSAHRANAIAVLSNSRDDGLDPDDYHLDAVSELISQNSEDHDINASIDILLTDGIILYGTHLLNGKTDPNTLEPSLRHEERILSAEILQELRGHLIEGNVQAVVEHLRPSASYYRKMMEGLKKYRALTDSGGWKAILVKEQKIMPGDSTTSIIKIRKRLAIEGDLTLPSDSLLRDSVLRSEHYDYHLQNAVRLFQYRHGLNDDGVIGRGTVKAMNILAHEKVDLLTMNLERARWLYHDMGKDYVLVNIAGFDLRLISDSTVRWKTRVMAGKTTSATPVFKDEIEYIDLNPEWRIPFSIADGEIVPKVQKDPTYLRRNNMTVHAGDGQELDVSKIDFKSIKPRTFPYFLRQGPGPGNSLGQVKFLFPNPHSVYLHDTPSKSLFQRQERAFSHGCIRVEDPIKLAELILRPDSVSRDSIDSVLQSKETERFKLNEKLPILITYSTAFAEDSLVYFYGDIYGRDPALSAALKN